MEMLLIFVVDHPVADTDFRKNILGVCGIAFQLPSDIGHIDTQDSVVAVRERSPYMRNEGVISDDAARILG